MEKQNSYAEIRAELNAARDQADRLKRWNDSAQFYIDKMNLYRALINESELALNKTGDYYFRERILIHIDSMGKYWAGWQRFSVK